jgi:hypothetical protein
MSGLHVVDISFRHQDARRIRELRKSQYIPVFSQCQGTAGVSFGMKSGRNRRHPIKYGEVELRRSVSIVEQVVCPLRDVTGTIARARYITVS